MRTIFCDNCDEASGDCDEPYEEDSILPGPCKDRTYPRKPEFVCLREHRELTGDNYWCMRCWDTLTAKEVDSSWYSAFCEGKHDLSLYSSISWTKRRCSVCKQWLETLARVRLVETTRYTVLLETDHQPIDGWWYGVLWVNGFPKDVRCPTHTPQQAHDEVLRTKMGDLERDLKKYKQKHRRKAA